jgi:hypothetical protein
LIVEQCDGAVVGHVGEQVVAGSARGAATKPSA